MSLWELFVIAAGLSMDAFAVSVCKGLSVGKLKIKHALICGVWFGLFQALMPAIGYLLGTQFEEYITSYDHWIAFVLLLLIGGNMVRESFSSDSDEVGSSFGFKAMLPLAVATSIDALAMGVAFASLDAPIIPAVSFIGCVTFTLSAVGVKIGNVFGMKYKAPAEFVGGVVLVLMGIKILLEHLGVISF